MKIRMLPSAFGGRDYQYLTTFLVDDRLAIDAGVLGFWGDLEGQASVDHVFVSHSHADHVCSLPMFVSNVFDRRTAPVVVHSHRPVLDSLRGDVFNDRLWPDFLRLTHAGMPLVALDEIFLERPCTVGHLTLTAVPVPHKVPTCGYLVDDGEAAVVISTDSGPTSRIWDLAGRVPHLKAVFIGVSYPNEEADLAQIAGHLTPRLAGAEAAKLPDRVTLIAVHLKPAHQAQVSRQLDALDLPNLTIGEAGRNYLF